MIIGGITLGNPQLPYEKKSYKPFLQAEFESNDIAIRQLNTRTRRQWVFNWDGNNLLTKPQFDQLEAFLLANQGKTFTMVLPYHTEVISNIFNTSNEINGAEVIPDIPSKGIVGMVKLSLTVSEL